MTFIWITGFKVQNTENQKHKSWIILSRRCAFETKTGLINLPYKCCSDQGEFNSVKRYKLIVYLLFLSCYLECFPCFLVTILPWPQASLSYLLRCICFSRSGVITNATRVCSLRAGEDVLCTFVPICVNCSILKRAHLTDDANSLSFASPFASFMIFLNLEQLGEVREQNNAY